jgi:hypothetical protein
MRMTEQLQQISNTGVNFEEDDDKFFIGLDTDEAREELERKRQEKKLKYAEKKEEEAIEFEPIRKNLYIESKEI